VGERLLISHPEFSLVIQRKAQLVVLLDKGAFFKQYHVQELKLAPKQPSRMNSRVAEIMAWSGGKRVGLGSKEYANSVRWVRLGAPGYILYSVPDGKHPRLDQPPPATGLALAASDLDELSSLVNSRTPATITE
jgi:hypothetical protein